jgi:hypothetical protein
MWMEPEAGSLGRGRSGGIRQRIFHVYKMNLRRRQDPCVPGTAMTEIKTMMGQEAQTGLRYFAGLELISVSDYRDGRRASSVTVGTSADTVSFSLTWDALSDLPNTPEYRNAAQEFAASLSGRMACGHSAFFYCSSGVPIRIEIEWPIQPIPQTAAAYVHAEVWDLRRPEHVAYCSVVITHQEETLDIKEESL